MNDLISRSALLAYLENEKRKIKADSKKYRIHEEAVAGMKASLQAIEHKVNEMPTAYDVEKVVAEFEQKIEFYRLMEIETLHKGMASNTRTYTSNRFCFENALEIVKRGDRE